MPSPACGKKASLHSYRRTALARLVGDLIDRAFADSEKREEARLKLCARMQESRNQLDLVQLEVNKAEASTPVCSSPGGGRSSAGCAAAPTAPSYSRLPAFGFAALCVVVPLPQFDMDALGWVLGGLLGLGTMRTVETVKGVTLGMIGQLPWRAGK